MRQSESVPVCSTVFELNPSIPTQNDEYWFVEGQVPWMAGTIQDPLTSETEPALPVTAYPAQFRLLTLASRSWEETTTATDDPDDGAATGAADRRGTAIDETKIRTQAHIAIEKRRIRMGFDAAPPRRDLKISLPEILEPELRRP